jgi:hypothetical protein
MLDIEEFHKAKKRVFEKRNSLHDLSTLESYIEDLEIVCINERSSELAEILEELIKETESFTNLEMHFKLLLLYFQQIYHYMQNLDKVKQIVEKMESIKDQTQNIEHITFTLYSRSIMNRIVGSINDSNNNIRKAMEAIKSEEMRYPDAYHRILYTFSIFLANDRNQPEVIENVNTCVNYWYSNQNTLPMIMGIIILLRSHSTLGDESKFDELISWVFSEEKIQDRVINSHFTILYSYVGSIYAIKSQIPEAISYLQKAHDRVNKTDSQDELMYEFIEIQRLLCRLFAFQGLYEESYTMLIDFLSYIESDFVRRNYYEDRIKTLYFGAYYTLLFIYAQLDVSISSIDDEKLLRIHNYAKDLIEKSQISRDLLLDTILDEREIEKIDKEKSLRPVELYLNLRQQLISLETYSVDEKTIKNINLIRDYISNPLYADIVIGKIHLSMGDFKNFSIAVQRLNAQNDKAETPILQIWIQLFNLLNQFLENPEDTQTITEIQNLENYCRSSKFFKMAEEINLYWVLLKSSLTVEAQSNRFQQTAFVDLYNQQSRKMVIDILDQRESKE